ncbi:MAG: hypothetical protein AAF702_27735 [Chloroflexota bacterium]
MKQTIKFYMKRLRYFALLMSSVFASLFGLGVDHGQVKAQPPALITVNLVIEEVKALDGVDGDIFSSPADFFAQNIQIDGHNFPATAVIDDQDNIAPHWRFGYTPSLSGRTGFPVDIEIWDDDDTSGDDKIDLFSSGGRKLQVFVAFDEERCGISGIDSDGDVAVRFSDWASVGYWNDGVCRIDRTDRGNENDAAEITYSIQLLTEPTGPLIPLYGWYDPIRGDNFATSDVNWYGRPGDKRSPNYGFTRIEGYIYNPLLPPPSDFETEPLYSWWSDSRKDNFATTHPSWVWNPDEFVLPDYSYVRLEGHVLTEPAPDSLPLHGWYSQGRGDNFATTHPSWLGSSGETRTPDYGYVRLEGYLYSDAESEQPPPSSVYLIYLPIFGGG